MRWEALIRVTVCVTTAVRDAAEGVGAVRVGAQHIGQQGLGANAHLRCSGKSCDISCVGRPHRNDAARQHGVNRALALRKEVCC